MKRLDESRDARRAIDPAPESHEGMSMQAIFEGFAEKITEDALDAFWPNRRKHSELNGNGVTEEELSAKLAPNVRGHIRNNLLAYDLLVREHKNPEQAFQKLIEILVSEAQGRAQLIYSELIALKKAGIDALTGLPNVSIFKYNLKVGIQRNQRLNETFSAVFFDLDHFKAINDTHGHQAGDSVLQEMARRLAQDAGLRKLDLVARYGGEEFVLLLPVTSKQGACIVAQRVSEQIGSKPFKIINKEGKTLEIKVTASIGVSEFANAEEDPKGEELLRRADTSLYVLKGKEPDVDGVVANRRGLIACDNKVITPADIENYKEMMPDRRSGLTPRPANVTPM